MHAKGPNSVIFTFADNFLSIYLTNHAVAALIDIGYYTKMIFSDFISNYDDIKYRCLIHYSLLFDYSLGSSNMNFTYMSR